METHDHIPEYLMAYLGGEASEEQTQLAAEWLKSPENNEIFSQLKKIESLTSDLQLLKNFNVQEGKQKVRRK